MKKPFQLYLDPRDHGLLAELAKRHGLSMAQAVREAVRRWAVDDAGTDDPLLGLIGSVDDADVPGDLSTRHDDYAVEGYPARHVAEPDEGDRS